MYLANVMSLQIVVSCLILLQSGTITFCFIIPCIPLTLISNNTLQPVVIFLNILTVRDLESGSRGSKVISRVYVNNLMQNMSQIPSFGYPFLHVSWFLLTPPFHTSFSFINIINTINNGGIGTGKH